MSVETQIAPVELAVVVKGEVVSENFEAFKEFALSKLAGINLDLKTDNDFKQAKLDIADLKKFDETLLGVDREIIESMDHVNKLLTGTRELRKVSGEKKKHLTDLAKTRTAEIKSDLVKAGMDALDIKTTDFGTAIQDSIKGMSSLQNMQEKITAIVEGINNRIGKAREIIEATKAEHGSDICHGEKALLLMPIEALETELERRVERRAADRKAEALRKETEELKAKANAAAKDEANRARVEEGTRAQTKPDAHPSSGPSYLNRGVQPKPSASDHEEAPALSQADEMVAFLAIFPDAFAPIKAARAQLKHAANIAAGERFADAFGKIYAELERGAK